MIKALLAVLVALSLVNAMALLWLCAVVASVAHGGAA